jgi:fermentation-respiration switch protein FrsA (DUF1100 family)
MIVLTSLKICLLLTSIYLFFRWFERCQIWIPKRELIANPSEIGLVYKDVFFQSLDGTPLHGWFIPHQNAIATILFCHGNAGNISHRLESIRQFHSIDVNVFVFDYRGYGNSDGWLTEQGTCQDAIAAFNWIHSNHNEPIILFGRSMGAAIAIDIAAHVKADGLIAESGFMSIKEIGKEIFPFLPVSQIVSIQYDSISKIEKISIPKLLIHSRDDHVVPFSHSEALYQKATPPKEFFEIHGDHNDGHFISEEYYLPKLHDFVKSVN